MTQRTRTITKKKVVYICHPYRGDIRRNCESVRRICAEVKHECVPLAPQLMLPDYIDEITDRLLACEHGLALLSCVDELWVCTKLVSEGMKAEIAEAERLGIPVIRLAGKVGKGRKR